MPENDKILSQITNNAGMMFLGIFISRLLHLRYTSNNRGSSLVAGSMILIKYFQEWRVISILANSTDNRNVITAIN